jgi:hypothetical protein
VKLRMNRPDKYVLICLACAYLTLVFETANLVGQLFGFGISQEPLRLTC